MGMQLKKAKAQPEATVPVPPAAPERPKKKITSIFYAEAAGNEPVRKFLRGLAAQERTQVGADIRTTEYGWPIGMPTCRALGGGLHEVRTNLTNRIARILFRVNKTQEMVLLHGFIKKTEATPQEDIDLANARWSTYQKGQK